MSLVLVGFGEFWWVLVKRPTAGKSYWYRV